jgi:hypothetical protein
MLISHSLSSTYTNAPEKTMHFLDTHIVFGSARTEWSHLANPQLAWHSYCKVPVAVPIPLDPNASRKQYECGPTQPFIVNKAVVNRKLVVETQRVKTLIIIIIIYTKHNHYY